MHLGAYLYEINSYLILAILNQMREKHNAWLYQPNIRYVKYAQAMDSINGAKYYSNIDLNLGNALDSERWKIDTTTFDFTDWEVGEIANYIILTYKGAKKFTSQYLQENLTISFTPLFSNTDNSTITIDGVEKRILNKDTTLLASGNIIATLTHTI